MESTDLTQNSRKAWHNIRKISNDPTKPSSQYEVTANQVAHVLIKNGKTQVMKKQPKIEIPYSKQGCGSGYFSNASASTPIASASASINKKRKNDR